MLRGSCACGSLRYEIDSELIGPLTYCHCWRCRKQSGSSFGTTAGIPKGSLSVVAGEQFVRHWESSPGVRRYFASCCGSPIWKEDDLDGVELGFRLGTLDDAPNEMAQMHFHTGSKAPWVKITDDLRQENGGVPFGGRDPDNIS